MKTLGLILGVVLLGTAVTASAESPYATTVTAEEIRADYAAGGPVKILIMPGHEPTYGGAIYLTHKERDIAVEISNTLAEYLRANPQFQVTVGRDTTAWLPELSDYFENEWKAITRYVKSQKREMASLIRHDKLEDRDFEVPHNSAATDVALRLYGINKWASENDYDIAIHVHLNDAVDHTATTPGNHSGFAVYIPDSQFGNGAASHALGESIAFELNNFNASSTLPIENYAIVEDQDLIAVGAFNTAEFASVLIEYAYIYESKITNLEARPAVLNDMAYQTYHGVLDFVGAPTPARNTKILPYAWVEGELKLNTSSTQAYALQVGLQKLGFYPPQGQLIVGCPISGYVGECTVSALKAFQKSKGLEQTGSIGPKTKAALKAAGV